VDPQKDPAGNHKGEEGTFCASGMDCASRWSERKEMADGINKVHITQHTTIAKESHYCILSTIYNFLSDSASKNVNVEENKCIVNLTLGSLVHAR
jgi:hypothetical protein